MMDLEHPECAGVKACEETFRWIWDNHFAAVGSDNFPFEAFPPTWEKSCRKFSFLKKILATYCVSMNNNNNKRLTFCNAITHFSL